jgi:hypothetical protein
MPTKTLPVKLLLLLGSKLEFMDEWGHRLHLPHLIQSPICDAWDWHLGVFDADEWSEIGEIDDDATGADSGADCRD